MSETIEIWKDIAGYEGLYKVSNLGRVKSLRLGKERILKAVRDKGGYLMINLYKEGKQKMFLVHRLVATAFLENPLKLKEVNHINENKEDNSVENLEWCSREYNCNYGTHNKRMSETLTNRKDLSKQVIQYTKDLVFIKEFPSTKEVERQLGYSSCNISQCCNGKRKTAHGYIWRYK